MRSAEHTALAVLIFITLSIAGCATSSSTPTGARTVMPPVTTEQKTEAAVSPVVQRDFAGALSAIKLGRYQDAERALLTLTREHPELSGPHANLGIVYYRLGKLPEAVESLNKAIELNPDRAAYYNQLGIVYRQSGQLDKARESYARALAVDPLHLNSHLNIGILYDLYLQEHGKALQHYERYQALLPVADAQVNKWIVDLKQRQQSSDKTALRSDQ
jgi:tetratricopeptide (TPR) repeat protein